MVRLFVWLALGLALLFHIGPAQAHHIALDRLVLRPVLGESTLYGELTLDPELARRWPAPGSAPSHEQKLLALLAANLRVEVDRAPVDLSYSVRELWRAGGATGGDLVVFSAALPRNAASLRVFTGTAFRTLVVSVQLPTPSSRAETRSWLSRGGEWSPAYELQKPAESAWKLGDPETLFRDAGAEPAESLATPPSDLPEPPAAPSPSRSLGMSFLQLGFEHILPAGVDHLAFVAALVLGGGRRYKHTLIALSVFTLAHTVTLALAALGALNVPALWVEPLIALSIFAVGVHNVLASHAAEPSVWRHVIVFGFGLVHGLGFAGGLRALGPAAEGQSWLLALFAFNLGVELGQLCVALPLLIGLLVVRDGARSRRFVVVPGSAAIAAVGLLLFFDRLLADQLR